MIDFPDSAKVHKRMPKDVFYRHLKLTKALKESFVSDVESIFVEYSLTNKSLRLTADSKIKEIIVMSIGLKRDDLNGKLLEAISRQNQHKLLFLLFCGSKVQPALFYGRLYRGEWFAEDEFTLQATGFSLDEIWDSFTEQIALCEERALNVQNLSLDERLSLQDEIIKAEKLIEKTEAAAWKEVQPKKRFELYSRLSEYKKHLEELKKGNNFVK